LGVGLSKAWRFVTNHGGTITVAPVDPHGARFTIRVPIKSQTNETADERG
jgi:K+-sensing histidine kinase KdpD